MLNFIFPKTSTSKCLKLKDCALVISIKMDSQFSNLNLILYLTFIFKICLLDIFQKSSIFQKKIITPQPDFASKEAKEKIMFANQ